MKDSFLPIRKENIFIIFLAALIWLLPWQTRYFIVPGIINHAYFEYRTISLYATELLAWVIIVGVGVNSRAQIRIFLRNLSRRHFFYFGILGIVISIAIVFSVVSWLSVYTVYRWILAVCLAGIVGKQLAENRLILLSALWAGGVVQALLALYQFFSQTIPGSKWLGMAVQLPQTLGVSVVENSAGRWVRAYGSFGWPTSLGIYLALTLIVGALLTIMLSSRRARLALFAGELIMAAGLFVTFARGAWIATVIGLAVLTSGALWKYRTTKTLEDKRSAQILVMLCTSLVVVIGVYGYLMRPLLSSRLASVGALETRSITERVSQYRDAAALIKRHPFFGTGPGAYTSALASEFPDRDIYELQPVHNMFVLLIAEIGIPGSFLIFGLLGYVFWRARQNYMLLTPLAALMIAGLFDHWLLSLWGGLLTLAMASALSCNALMAKNTPRK